MDIIEQMEATLAEAIRSAESGEDWADVCALESELIALRRQVDEDNGQFGVGA